MNLVYKETARVTKDEKKWYSLKFPAMKIELQISRKIRASSVTYYVSNNYGQYNFIVYIIQ